MIAIIIKLIHVVVCFALILIVLFQADKGEGLAGAFGGGTSATIFGERGAETQISKMTTWLAIVFMITSTLIGIFGKGWDMEAKRNQPIYSNPAPVQHSMPPMTGLPVIPTTTPANPVTPAVPVAPVAPVAENINTNAVPAQETVVPTTNVAPAQETVTPTTTVAPVTEPVTTPATTESSVPAANTTSEIPVAIPIVPATPNTPVAPVTISEPTTNQTNQPVVEQAKPAETSIPPVPPSVPNTPVNNIPGVNE